MAHYSIGEVSARTGLAPSAIRYYEAEGLIPAPLRRSGKRAFDESVFDHLTVVGMAQAAGFGIREIREIKRSLDPASPPAQQFRAVASEKMQELDRRIDAARLMKKVLWELSHCGCATLTDCARAARTQADERTTV